jgi:catechol 2,3-dioxygenase
MSYHLFSQLGHVELFTTDLEASTEFFTDILGLEQSARTAESVYMRGWGEFHHHSLKLTASSKPGLGHMAFRTDGPEELEQVARIVEPLGLGVGYTDGDIGHGRGYRFYTPDGHLVEAFWEVDLWEAPEELRTVFKTRPQKYVTRSASCRRIDHVTVSCNEPEANRRLFERLGFRTNEIQRLDTGEEIFAFLSVTNLAHDVAFGPNRAGTRGRLDHVCFWEDTREEILRLADIASENGVEIEWGPSRHRGTEILFLYLREPGGNRIEICSGGYLIFAPDWAPVEWFVSERPAAAWAGDIPMSMIEAREEQVESPPRSVPFAS